jgi:hypothetical protein
MYSPATLNGTAPQAMVPQIGSTAVPFVRQEPPVQSGSPASSASAPTRRPRQAVASYIPAASTNLTDRQNYFFQRGGPELVQILMVMDDFRSGSVSSKPTVARFIEDVKFAFLNGNRGQRQEELPAVLSALQGAISFNSRMRATRDQAVAWASAQDWRLVPHVEEALSDCRRSVLKELYRGSPIREDLISIKRVIEKATDSAIVSGILPTTTTATPATTPPTMMTTTRNPRAAIDSYFDKYKTAAVVPYPDWAQGKFTFPDLDTILQVGLHGTEVKGGSWTHYHRQPFAGQIVFTQPSSIDYSRNLAGQPSRTTSYQFGTLLPTTVLLRSEDYSLNGRDWFPIGYPTNPALERLKLDNFERLISRGKTLMTNEQPRVS